MTGTERKPVFFKRRYLIDKRFQIKYTLMVVALSALIFAPLAYKLYLKEKANTEILNIRNPDVEGLVESRDTSVLYYLGGFFVLQAASLFVLGILITHRIAGPVSRVHRCLEEIAETGQVKPLDTVRHRDEFKEFFDALSDVIERLQIRSEKQKSMVAEIQSLLEIGSSDAKQKARLHALADELLKSL